MKFIIDSVLRKCKMEKGETEVIIPDGVTEIGDWAFSSCTSLQSVTIPDSVTEIGDSAFENCTSLQSVTIPVSVTKIGNSAFENCTSLQSVTIPDSVTEIGCFAFFKCTGLQSLTIPGGVTMIYINAFSRCDSLKSVTWNREITAWSWQKSGIRKMDLAIWFVERFLNGETFPGNILKSNMKYLKSRKKKWIEKFSSNILLLQYFIKTEAFNLEDTDELLDKFSDSVEITAMLLDYKNKHFSKEYIEKKENDKIDKELGLKELTIADWKKRFTLGLLGDDTYEVRKYKGSDTFVEIPECIGTKKVSGIGEKAFTNCTSLESVTIPDSVTEIGDSAFRNCTSLQSVTIPDNISFISPNAFDNTPFIENSQKDSMIIFGSILINILEMQVTLLFLME